MMQEIIDITPDMMHKYYYNLETNLENNYNSYNNSYNNYKYKLDVFDKYNKYNKNQKNEMKFVLTMIFLIPLFMYIVSRLSFLTN